MRWPNADLRALTVETPLGPLTLREANGAIASLNWGADDNPRETPLLLKACDQLLSYFSHRLYAFALPMAARGTPFQLRVWRAIQRIPYGTVLSYGDIAREIGSGPRAVGMACGANPIAILTPCHRVIGAQGRLGGYSGGSGLMTKRRLLALEGVLLPD